MTLDEALKLARANNGTIKAAQADIKASRARVKQNQANFLPSLTLGANYNDSVREIPNAQQGNQSVKFNQTSTDASLAWRPIDSGERLAQLRAARENASATEANAVNTLRNVLFSVEQQYFETLRAQELEKVANAQLARAAKVLDETKTRVQVGDAARREILQAEADALNAKVNAIGARTRTSTNQAGLKALIGANPTDKSPTLSTVKFDQDLDLKGDLRDAINSGMRFRPDLIARRKSNNAQLQSLRVAQIQAGVTWALDLSYSRQFTPSASSDRQVFLSLSYPLFDGGASKARVEEQRASIDSSQYTLLQAERDAQREIEEAYLNHTQSQGRLEAAELALKAAQLNYEAAEGSQKAGAADLIEVITAQVSLVTAE
ncbi:MAG TPA: TolC family protein, partial [Fimbriimonas sp.]|nr:TolC family protein [Fimbriimonas sp.]